MRSIISWLKSLFGASVITAPKIASPPYIDYSNDYIIPIPGMAKNSYLYCFPIHGDYQKMQSLIDKRLNFSPLNDKVKFFPLSDMMMLVMSDIKKGYSLDPSYTKYGLLEEKAMQIFLPVVECIKNDDNKWVAQRILCHIPYIFIDQPFSLSIGREVFGFSKSFGSFEIPDVPTNATKFSMKAYGFKNFNKQNPEYGDFHPLVSISQTDSTIPDGKWETHAEAWSHIKQHLNVKKEDLSFGLPFLVHELKDLAHGTVPMIFLKQFRDIENPMNACYQAVTVGDGRTEKFHGGWFLGGEYEIKIENVASYPIMEDLGLESTIKVKHPFWVHTDMTFNTGKAIWQSG